jgi:hypothetical protein
MDKVKGKKDGKKSDRPASSVDLLTENGEEPQKRSATMPVSSNIKKNAIKNKSKAMSVDELNRDDSGDDLDGKETKCTNKGAAIIYGRGGAEEKMF